MAQQPIFRPYTQGIQPLRGQMEAGQYIGTAMANALSSFGGDIAKGFEGYTKNKMVAEGAIAKAGAIKGQFDALYNSISGMPEFESVAEALKKQGDALSKAPSMSTPQALAEIEGAGAFLQSFPTIMQLTQAQAAYKARNAVREGLESDAMPKGGYEEIPIALPEGEATFDPTKPLVPQLKQLDDIVKQAAAAGAEVRPNTARKNYISAVRKAIGQNTTLAPQIRTNVIAQLDAYDRSEARFDQYLFPEVYGDDLLDSERMPTESGPPLFNPSPLEGPIGNVGPAGDKGPTGEGVSMSPQESMALNPNQTYIAASGQNITAKPRDSWLMIARRAGVDVGNQKEFQAFIDQSGYRANHVFKGGEVITIPSSGGKSSDLIRMIERDRQRKAGTLLAEEPLFNPSYTIEPEAEPQPVPVLPNVPSQASQQATPPIAPPAAASAPTLAPEPMEEMLPPVPEGGFGGFGRSAQAPTQAPQQADTGLPIIPEGGFGGFGRSTQSQAKAKTTNGDFDAYDYLDADAADQAKVNAPAVGKGNEFDNMAEALSKVTDPVKRKEAEQSFVKYWAERANAVGAGPRGNKILPPNMHMKQSQFIELIRAGKTDKEIAEMVKMTEKLYLSKGLGDEINQAALDGDVEKLEQLRARIENTDENWFGVAIGLGIVGAQMFLDSRTKISKVLPKLQQAAATPQASRITQIQSEIAAAEKGIWSSGRSMGSRNINVLNKELEAAIKAENASDDAARAASRAANPAARSGTQATAQAAEKTGVGRSILNVGGKIAKFGGRAIGVANYASFLYEVGLLTKIGFGDAAEERQKYLSGQTGAFGYKGLLGLVNMAMGENLEELTAQQQSIQETSGKIAGAYRDRFSKQTGYTGTQDIKPITLGDIDIAVSREFKAADKSEQDRYLKDFVVSKLGYMPADYDAVKATFMPDQPQFVETEHGTFYKGGAGDKWQPYKKESATLQDLRKEYTGVYGTPDGRGRFAPVRLEGGISMAGVFKGTDGMLKEFDAGVRLTAEARIALSSLKKLIADNPVGKSLSPDLRGQALALINRIKPAMRVDIIGVGTVSNFEQSILNASLVNPTEFFSFDSTSLKQIDLISEQFDRSVRNQGRMYGLEISLSDPLGLDRKQQVREAKFRRRANQPQQ